MRVRIVNKKIYDDDKHIICSVNGNIAYRTYCKCCGKYSSLHFKGKQFLNNTDTWVIIPEALKHNKNKTLTILFPYIEDNQIKFK
jgi:hypothetical protein